MLLRMGGICFGERRKRRVVLPAGVKDVPALQVANHHLAEGKGEDVVQAAGKGRLFQLARKHL